jgi:hypothetical protein
MESLGRRQVVEARSGPEETEGGWEGTGLADSRAGPSLVPRAPVESAPARRTGEEEEVRIAAARRAGQARSSTRVLLAEQGLYQG